VTPAGQVVDLPGHPDGAGVQVDVFLAESSQFRPAETGEGEEDKRTVTRPLCAAQMIRK
jgi:hypothetical protein